MRVPEAEQAAKLVSQPPLDTSHGKGRVRVRVVIGTDGQVKSATVAGGPRQLHEAALANARGRVYQPTMVDGKPVEVESEISINF
jgi:protein TonB